MEGGEKLNMATLLGLLIFGAMGYALGAVSMLDKVDEYHPATAALIRKDIKESWNSLVDSFRSRSDEEKIADLQDQLAEAEQLRDLTSESEEEKDQ